MISESELKVKNKLLEAFAEELKNVTSLTHEDCVELRSGLIKLRHSDVKRLLPHVLIDLLVTHTNDFKNTDDAEEIVWLLTPARPASDSATHNEIQVANIDREYLAKEKSRLFAEFSTGQAEAIAAWLGVAGGWSDLFFQKEEIASALNFWSIQASAKQEKIIRR